MSAALENLVGAMTPSLCLRKYWNKIVDRSLLTLYNALTNPDQITDLLLFELYICIKTPIMHLAIKCELKHMYFSLVKCIVNAFVRAIVCLLIAT